MRDIHRTFRAIAMNRAALELRDLTIMDPNNKLVSMATPEWDAKRNAPKVDKYGRLVYAPAKAGYVYIPVFVNGSRYNIEVPAEFGQLYRYGAPKMFSGAQDNPWFDAFMFAVGNKMLKTLTTGINYGFGIFQLIMDTPQAIMATDTYGRSFVYLGSNQFNVCVPVPVVVISIAVPAIAFAYDVAN